MDKGFGLSAKEIEKLGMELVKHLRISLTDTTDRKEWSKRNFTALRSFTPIGHEIQCFPSPASDGKERKAEFLWDFIAYVQRKGILIAVESEWENGHIESIQGDFDKLLYVRSPIKLMICRVDENKVKSSVVCERIFKYMNDCCSEFSPGEMFILYCRKWSNADGSNGDIVYKLQVCGEPMHQGITTERFSLFGTT
jgi:hypothetical protein